ncbi:hypothetical protein [Haloferula sargassicola]
MTTAAQLNEYRTAYSAAQAAAIRGGATIGQAASPEAEAKLSKLLAVTAGMFVASIASVVGVGIWIC